MGCAAFLVAVGAPTASGIAAPATAGSGHAACTPGKASASGDVDGDGRRDRVRFRGRSFGYGRLTVVLASGPRISRRTGLLTTQQAGIVRVAPVDARRGADILVLEQHISTCNTYVLYGLRGTAPRRVAHL